MTHAAAAGRRPPPPTSHRELTHRSNSRLMLGGILLLAALAVGLVVAVRSGPAVSRPIAGREHARGLSTAPVLVEEWSDFE